MIYTLFHIAIKQLFIINYVSVKWALANITTWIWYRVQHSTNRTIHLCFIEIIKFLYYLLFVILLVLRLHFIVICKCFDLLIRIWISSSKISLGWFSVVLRIYFKWRGAPLDIGIWFCIPKLLFFGDHHSYA